MTDKIRKFFLRRDVFETAGVWLIFGVIYAFMTPPFMTGLAYGTFLGAGIALFIGAVRLSGAFMSYILTKRRAAKMKSKKLAARAEEEYRSLRNPWLPAGLLLLIPAGILLLFFH